MAKIDDTKIDIDNIDNNKLKELILKRELENPNPESRAIDFLNQGSGINWGNIEALMRGFDGALKDLSQVRKRAHPLLNKIDEINKRCCELWNTKRSDIFSLKDPELKKLINELRAEIARTLKVDEERIEFRFINLGDSAALRGYIRVSEAENLKIPFEVTTEGELLFARTHGNTTTPPKPVTLTQMNFREGAVKVELTNHQDLARYTFILAKHILKEHKGNERMIGVQQSGGTTFALAKSNSGESYYLYTLESEKTEDGKEKFKITRQELKSGQVRQERSKKGSSSITVDLGNEGGSINFPSGLSLRLSPPQITSTGVAEIEEIEPVK
jgi:hypothetical protein